MAIVGAGFTGLWTAYYLKRADPSLRVLVLEAEHAGFGASARNGGWLSGFFSGPARRVSAGGGPAGSYMALQRAMFDTVGEVGAVLDRHGIDAELASGGLLTVAIDGAQLTRLREGLAAARSVGIGERDLRELSAAELSERLHVEGALGASYSPHAARVHPAKLLDGLAGAAEALGVEIYEQTPVGAIAPHRAQTAHGDVDARWMVRASEGYTASLRGSAGCSCR